jgi:O-antigen/teichoic acid export membrane protein
MPFLVGATAVGGLAGYAVTWITFRGVGPASYANFAVFWSALYLAIGGLLGLQQELARATGPKMLDDSPSTFRRARTIPFSAASALVTLFFVSLSSFAWAPMVFRAEVFPMVSALVVGVSAYAIMAVMSGALYGLSRWGTLAVLLVTDALLRLIFVSLGLASGAGVVGLAWLVVAPIPATLLICSPLLFRFLRGRTAIDVSPRQLAFNSTGTVLAALATSLLVSGFPLLLGIAGSSVDPDELGSVVFAITLTRAPLVITVMSLQSYLVVVFKSAGRDSFRRLGLFSGVVGIAAVILGLVVSFAGIPLLTFVAGRDLGVDVLFFLLLVGSSFLLAMLSITGALVLAEGRHRLYLAGWGVAAVATSAILLGRAHSWSGWTRP